MQRLRLDGDVFGGGFRARIAAARAGKYRRYATRL
jgi:hypothetical protein